MGFLALISLVAVVFSSCSQIRDKMPTRLEDQNQVQSSTQLGQVQNTEGQLVNLDDSSFEAVVIIFASDTCSTCAEEARYWVQEMNRQLPTNVLFTHYIIGGNAFDAKDWKEVFSIPWPVLISEEDDLYRQYCPAIITPCTVIRNNNSKETHQTYSPLRKQDIERYTGKWKN